MIQHKFTPSTRVHVRELVRIIFRITIVESMHLLVRVHQDEFSWIQQRALNRNVFELKIVRVNTIVDFIWKTKRSFSRITDVKIVRVKKVVYGRAKK